MYVPQHFALDGLPAIPDAGLADETGVFKCAFEAVATAFAYIVISALKKPRASMSITAIRTSIPWRSGSDNLHG